jgi:serine/threonine protein phosphatase PrpC
VTVRGQALTVRAYGATHTGRVRAGNEDSFLVGDAVHAVADGMGGHQAGEIASDAALEPLRILDVSSLPGPEEVSEALAAAVRDANTVVVERASSDPQLEGMGTTLTAVAVRGGQLHVAHVGDSRAYLLRDDEQMSQLTTDHTLVERLVREGRLSRDEAATHPQRNVITRAIGHETTVEVEVLPPITLHDGDQVLLCSDGLSGPVDDTRIASILANAPAGDKAVAALLAQANAAGGPDNITAVLLRVGDRWAQAPPADEPTDGSTTQQIASLPGDADTAGEPVPGARAADPSPGTHDRVGGGAVTQTEARGNGPAVTSPGDVPSPPPATAVDEREAPPRWRRLIVRSIAALTALVVVGALVIGGGWMLLSRSYFVGEHEGMVAIYHGIPQEVAGVSAARVVPTEITTTPVTAFPEFRQQAITDGLTAQSLTDAQRIVEDLQEQAREAQESAPSIGEPLAEPTQGP